MFGESRDTVTLTHTEAIAYGRSACGRDLRTLVKRVRTLAVNKLYKCVRGELLRETPCTTQVKDIPALMKHVRQMALSTTFKGKHRFCI